MPAQDPSNRFWGPVIVTHAEMRAYGLMQDWWETLDRRGRADWLWKSGGHDKDMRHLRKYGTTYMFWAMFQAETQAAIIRARVLEALKS